MPDMFKLERNIELYRSQFEKFSQSYFGDYRLDRYSIELDSVLFKMKYMEMRHLITDEDIPKLKDEFTTKAVQLRNAFGELMIQFVMEFLQVPDRFTEEDIEDILVMDVKMDPIYVHFRLIVVSPNEEFLQFLDRSIPVDTFNMYPDEYFRFHTDSYNDGIAKAYPELFENRHVNVGKGDDGDVFVHSFTFQVTEDCSYQCFSGDTLITMADGTKKPISEVQVGDMVMGVDEKVIKLENNEEFYNAKNFHPTKVVHVFERKAETIGLEWKDIAEGFRVTPDHPFASVDRCWKKISDILDNREDGFLFFYDGYCSYTNPSEFKIDRDLIETDVYNLETECHTFVASDLVCHNCSYCFSGDTMITMADGTKKPISEVQVGDMVLSVPENIIELHDDHSYWDEKFLSKSNLIPTEVKAMTNSVRRVYGLTLCDDGEVTKVTADHPFLTNKGFMNLFQMLIYESDESHYDYDLGFIRNIDSDEFWFKMVNTPFSYSKIDLDCGYEPTYNMETGTHTYIANDFVVHNCYQTNKTPMHMEFSTAKKFIDHLLNDDYSYINRHNSPALILEFIGGEPFLQTKLIRQIYDYFLDRCYYLNHPWFNLHRVSICSNGSHYFTPDVQSLFQDYSSQISFNISIDGNKSLHDSCRVDKEGKGTYDRCMKALNHFNAHYSPERNSKMTLAPQNISYLYDSVVDFIKNGMKVININCVFEEGWTPETARIEYFQLCKISDYLLENDLENIYIAIFNERQEGPYEKSFNGTSCGGNGSMLAMRPNGQFYPCLRYMPSSVGDNVKDLCIGDVDHGLVGRTEDSEVLQLLDSITRRSQNNDICYECPLANDCPSCLAHGHTVFGTPDKRATFICIQVIAEALANVYHWNRMILKHPEWDLEPRKNVVPDEWSSIILDEKELKDLKDLEEKAFLFKKE